MTEPTDTDVVREALRLSAVCTERHDEPLRCVYHEALAALDTLVRERDEAKLSADRWQETALTYITIARTALTLTREEGT